MKVAFVIFDRMTALDFIGFYDTVTRLKTMDFLPDVEWQVCARTVEVHNTCVFTGDLEFFHLSRLVIPLSLVKTHVLWILTGAPIHVR